jgi:hypothetical protein
MRLLIAFYVIHGATLVAMVLYIVGEMVADAVAVPPGRATRKGIPEEAVLVAVVSLVMGTLTLLAACGLWRRWQVVRLILLGLSWWIFLCSPVIAGISVAALLGVERAPGIPLDTEPWSGLAVAGGMALFAGWQYWCLVHPQIRAQFVRSTTREVTVTPIRLDK